MDLHSQLQSKAGRAWQRRAAHCIVTEKHRVEGSTGDKNVPLQAPLQGLPPASPHLLQQSALNLPTDEHSAPGSIIFLTREALGSSFGLQPLKSRKQEA